MTRSNKFKDGCPTCNLYKHGDAAATGNVDGGGGGGGGKNDDDFVTVDYRSYTCLCGTEGDHALHCFPRVHKEEFLFRCCRSVWFVPKLQWMRQETQWGRIELQMFPNCVANRFICASFLQERATNEER